MFSFFTTISGAGMHEIGGIADQVQVLAFTAVRPCIGCFALASICSHKMEALWSDSCKRLAHGGCS